MSEMKKVYIAPCTTCVTIVCNNTMAFWSFELDGQTGSTVPQEEPAENEALSRETNNIWEEEPEEDEMFGCKF